MNEKLVIKNLLPCVKEAGRRIIEIYNFDPKTEIKKDGSPVTLADKAAEKILLTKIKELHPNIPIVSEENPDSHSLQPPKEFFLVDPLDGTKEFLKHDGKGSFTVNIAFIKDRSPIFGIVYAPALNRLFYASKSIGAYEEDKNGLKKIKIRQSIKDHIVAVASSSHRDQETIDWLENNHILETISIGSSLKFCLVASGEADVYPRFGPTMEWDTAAGDAILRFAGGNVENINGTNFKYGKKEFRNTSFIAKGDF